jgi:hypothetical protein
MLSSIFSFLFTSIDGSSVFITAWRNRTTQSSAIIMALALRSAAPLRSDVALAQAISEFELLLTPEQKTSFNDLRTRAIRSAPSADDVMKQTADINQRLVTPKQASSSMYRCFGTRFSNVLQCLQRYAALGEVVAGGSQNIIACGVWALMRVTIQVRLFLYLTLLVKLNSGSDSCAP